MTITEEERKAADEQTSMVDLRAPVPKHTRERALAMRAVIIHIAYVIEVQDPYAGQTDRHAAPYRFGRQVLYLQVISAERTEQAEEKEDTEITESHITVAMLPQRIFDSTDDRQGT